MNDSVKSTFIPFNRPSLIGQEQKHILEAIQTGHVSGDGSFTEKCKVWLEAQLDVKAALLTTSCTHALEMSALLLNIKPGDEVIVPSFTFVSTVNAFVLRGATPIFADIRPDTLNLDDRLLENLVTPQTKAIIPVHYAGVACEMDMICSFAQSHKVAVVEDNAHGLLGKYKGKSLGSFGVMATQSFHETKNFSCGEGGALLINDAQLIERAEIIREKGTNRSLFFRGEVDKYTWVDLGSSYVISDVLAAFLYAQFEGADKIQSTRRKTWERYDCELKDWAAKHEVKLPYIPEYCQQAYHMYYLILPSCEISERLRAFLKKRDILSVFHYLPLNSSPMGKKFGGHEGDCPVSEDVSGRLIRLPFFNNITEQEQTRVLAALHDFDQW